MGGGVGRRWGVADAGVLRAWDGGTGGGQGGRMHVEFKRGVGRVVHGVLKIVYRVVWPSIVIEIDSRAIVNARLINRKWPQV